MASTFILTACHEACQGGCTGSSPKDCELCKEGWEQSDEEGCKGKTVQMNAVFWYRLKLLLGFFWFLLIALVLLTVLYVCSFCFSFVFFNLILMLLKFINFLLYILYLISVYKNFTLTLKSIKFLSFYSQIPCTDELIHKVAVRV